MTTAPAHKYSTIGTHHSDICVYQSTNPWQKNVNHVQFAGICVVIGIEIDPTSHICSELQWSNFGLTWNLSLLITFFYRYWLFVVYCYLYPEWLHSVALYQVWSLEAADTFMATHMHCAIGAQCILPVRGGGKGQSIGSPISDVIVLSWLKPSATGNCQKGYFSSITNLVNNWPYKQWL